MQAQVHSKYNANKSIIIIINKLKKHNEMNVVM